MKHIIIIGTILLALILLLLAAGCSGEKSADSVPQTTAIAREVWGMMQIDNTEVGPIIICDGCYNSMNRHSIEKGEGRIVAIDISNEVSQSQQCDLCGDRQINPRELL